MPTQEIIFENPEHLTFMCANIFGHDFLHDFNPSKFAKRLSRLSNEITQVHQYVNNTISRSYGGKKRQKSKHNNINKQIMVGGNNWNYLIIFFMVICSGIGIARNMLNNSDEDKFDMTILESDYEGFDNIDNYMDFIINKYFDSSESDIIEVLTNYITNAEKKTITRAAAHRIQVAKDFISDTKLYVIGEIKKLRITGGEKSFLNENIDFIKKPTIFNIEKKNEMIDNVPSFSESIKVINKDVIDEKYYLYMRNAFQNTIQECDDNHLKRYFEIMKKIYLYLENQNQHPFITFNSDLIEDVLLLYLFSGTESTTLNDADIHNILNDLIQWKSNPSKNSQMNKDDKMVGGATQQELQEIINLIKTNRNTSLLYNHYMDKTIIIDINDNIVNGCITTIRENIRNNQLLNGIINSNRIDKMIADINSKLVQYNAARSRNRVNMKSAVISSIEYLLMDYLYNKINGEIHKITAINENINDSVGSLSPQEKNTVQHISRLVAKNTIEYIIADSNKTDKLLEDSYDILKSIADKNIGYSTLDNKLRESFIEYARENNHQVVLTNSDEISQEIQKAKKNKMLIRTINNAATAQITKLKIDTNTEIICPTSSVVDAMGAMGSCYQLARNDRKKEYYNMDFMMITNIEGNNDFYQGSTILSENNNRLTIQYSATINDFILPYVTIPIDITTPKILSLSAGQTFKSVLQKIILIWMNSFQSTFAPSEEQLWQTLENKKIYEDLASVGSIKSVGDFFQEINSVVVNGGYSANGVVQPTQFRIGANGDQPSGVRAGFILLNATANSLHDNSMAGYLGENGEDDNVVILNLRQTKISSKPVEASIQPKNPSKASIQPKNPSKASSKKTKGGKKTKKIRYATYKKSRKNL